MSLLELKQATKQAHTATACAKTAEDSHDYLTAAGFYRTAAELWRLANDEEQAAKCEMKADEMEGEQ